MRSRTIIRVLFALIVVGAIAYSGWRLNASRTVEACQACQRPVHAHMRTVAIVDGHRAVYCCPACALSERRQSGGKVRIVELTDYLDNVPLKPDESFVVRNSDVNPCLQHHHPAVGQDSQPLHADFDRCSPSVLAFKTQQSAQTFAREHGGEVMRFTDFASTLSR